MSLITGDFIGRCARAEIGDKDGTPTVRIQMEVTEGEHRGKRFQYENKLDEKQVKYTRAAMVAVGWKGPNAATFADDVASAGIEDIPFEVGIATWKKPDGTIKEWSSVRRIGGPAALTSFDRHKLARVNEWLAAAVEDDLP